MVLDGRESSNRLNKMQIFPTAYFAPIAYYKAFANADNPVVEVKEHFVKQTIRTRCEVLGPNGKQLLSVPVERINGNKTAIEDLIIVEDGWRKIHWKTIETAYSSAPFFDYYGIEIKELLMDQSLKKLTDLNDAIHQRILSWLDVQIPSSFTNDFEPYFSTDYRLIKLDSEVDFEQKAYYQVFRNKTDCISNLSILDLILNEGPMARKWLLD